MNARGYLAELLGTFLFMMVGYASVANFGLAQPAIRGSSSSPSRSDSACSRRSMPSVTSPAAISTRP